MMLSFLLCVILIIAMIGISKSDRGQEPVRCVGAELGSDRGQEPVRRLVVTLWLLLTAVMVGLYIFFN